MSKETKKQRKKKQIRQLLAFILLTLFAVTFYNIFFLGKIFPGVYVSGINIGGLTTKAASEKISNNIHAPEKIILTYQNQNFKISLSDLGFSYDFIKTAEAAYNIDRTGNFLFDFKNRTISPFRNKNVALRFEFDQEKLNENLATITSLITLDPVYPSVSLSKGKVVVEKGLKGSEIDTPLLQIEIEEMLAFAKWEPISINVKTIDPTLTDEEVRALEERAKNLLGKSLIINFEYQTFTYKNNDIFALLGPKGGFDQEAVNELSYQVAADVNREPQNSVFVFEDGRVKEFAPSKDGVSVKTDELSTLIIQNLQKLEETDEKSLSLEIPTTTTPPKIKTEEVNNLGIRELIGRGSSRFRGSISSRIHNISVASSRFKGVLLAPGETFSFNDTLGDVSAFTGYKQAYVIKEGRTVLGDGGGVCQVSTTLFRAALDAGLPITERRAHSYRVGYYEQDSSPGFDATVYAPTTDLKFKNDTPSHILIQAIADPKRATLVFEIYGTSDGRVAKTTKPTVASVVAPPEDLYQDDPTLPAGTIKQVDYKAWGAKVIFNYTVERDGETIYQKTFVSNYRPWQAVYLRGTAPVQ